MGDEVDQQQELKGMKFEPILNVKDDVKSITAPQLYKCSIQSDLGLLAISTGHTFYCVNMADNQVIFKVASVGTHSHHWITINDQTYLSLQSKQQNKINVFRVSD